MVKDHGYARAGVGLLYVYIGSEESALEEYLLRVPEVLIADSLAVTKEPCRLVLFHAKHVF